MIHGVSSLWKFIGGKLPATGIFCVALLTGCTAPKSAKLAKPAWDFGPFAAGVADINGGQHAKVAGPLYEHARSTNDGTLLAVRPFYSRASETNEHLLEEDYLWPIAQRWDFLDQSVSRWGIFFNYDHDTAATNDARHRLWLLPFWYSGRDANGTNYWALFPIYGSVHEFLGRDEFNFALFPVWSTSRLKDIETWNVMWPLLSSTSTKDGRIRRHRFFPLYGYNYSRNHFTKRSVLWPIWTSVKYDYPKDKGGGWILFPVCGRMKTQQENTLWVVPPFFRFTDGEKLDRIYCPWPFVQLERGKDYDKTYVWPLWGHKHVGNLRSTFVLWPIIRDDTTERGWNRDHQFIVNPIYRYSSRMTKGEGTNAHFVAERQHKVWPLMNYHYEDGAAQFRTLDLWPLADNAHVDRNWSPWWTLYNRTWRGDDLDTEALWGFYRHQRRGDEASYVSVFPFINWRRDEAEDNYSGWSFLKGLIARDKTDHGTSWRFLYFLRLGNSGEQKP